MPDFFPPKLIAGAIIFMMLVGTRAGAVSSPPSSPPMQLGKTITLPYAPGRVLFRPGYTVFVVSSLTEVNRETATVSAYSVEDASSIFRFYVLHSVDAMAFSGNGDWLFLVGGRNGEGFASRVRVSEAIDARPSAVTTIKLAKLPVQPSIAVDREQTLYIGDATSDRLIAIGSSVFDRAQTVPELDATKFESQFFSWAGGVHAIAVSESLNLAFVSNEVVPKISTLRLGGATQVVTELTRSPGRRDVYGLNPIPLAMLMTTGVKTEGGKWTTSLLIGDHPSLTLTIVDFDPIFRTMDVVANALIGIRIEPKSNIQVDQVTKLITQPIMIGSDDRENTILVGDIFSTQLVQMTRGTRGASLERVGEIPIPGFPTSISVSGDGKAAVVAIANSHDVWTLRPPDSTSSVPDANAKIRQLQRELAVLGLDVGGIDGRAGQATFAALNVFNSATGDDASLNNIDDAIKLVEGVGRNCVTFGLHCLVNSQQRK
jgi:hypothetical protein